MLGVRVVVEGREGAGLLGLTEEGKGANLRSAAAATPLLLPLLLLDLEENSSASYTNRKSHRCRPTDRPSDQPKQHAGTAGTTAVASLT